MKLTVKPSTYIFVVLLLLILPVQWVVAWLLAMAFHEMSHYLAVRFVGGQVYSLLIGLGGLIMECSPITNKKQLIAVLAGPLGGFLLIFLGKWFPRLAICSWILSAYNLLPILPLDGGRVLQMLLGRRLFVCVELAFLILISAGAIYCLICLQEIFPLLIAAGLWLRNRNRP